MNDVKDKSLYTCRVDRIFKAIIVDSQDYSILEAILSTILDGNVKIVNLPRTEIATDTPYEKVKTRDIVILLDGEFINLEIETGTSEITRAKNFTYHTSMWKKNIIRGEQYDIKTKFIQIILQYNLNPENLLIKEFKMIPL